MKMPRVITARLHSVISNTSSSISSVLILLLMSLFLSGKTFGAAIVAEDLKSHGKDSSSIQGDQTTDWQWSTSASSFDGNLNLLGTDAYNEGEWQTIRSADKNVIFDGQADQAYPLTSIPLDRLTTQDPKSFGSYTLLDPWFLLFLLVTLGIGLVLGKALAKQEKCAIRRKHRIPRRRLSIASEMARIRGEKRKTSYFHSNPFPPS